MRQLADVVAVVSVVDMAVAVTSAARTNQGIVLVTNRAMLVVIIIVALLAIESWAKNQPQKNLTVLAVAVLTIAIKSVPMMAHALLARLLIVQVLATELMQSAQRVMLSVLVAKIMIALRLHVKWMAIAVVIPKTPICNLPAL